MSKEAVCWTDVNAQLALLIKGTKITKKEPSSRASKRHNNLIKGDRNASQPRMLGASLAIKEINQIADGYVNGRNRPMSKANWEWTIHIAWMRVQTPPA